MNTNYSRDRDGHRAKSVHDLGNQRELQISTWRWADGNLVTNATVHRIDGHARIHVMGLGTGGGDFSKRIVFSRPSRVTANVIRAQHEQSLSLLPEIIQAVNQHYQAQGAGESAHVA